MKLLFDQNISHRILHVLEEHFDNCKQVRSLNLENISDNNIWNYAKINNYAIVTFDADFSDIANLKGHPPKIIWLRTGNMTTNSIAELLIIKKELIISFLKEEEFKDISCLEIY